MKKLASFCREVYHPGVHLYFSLNWYLALFSGLCLVHGRPFTLGPDALAVTGTLFLVLFYLRIIDEVKDFDYDRVFNPSRPLVRGLVTVKDLQTYLFVLIIPVIGLNILYGGTVIGLLAVELLYAYLLLPVDRLRPIRENVILNLFVTYPVNILLSVYVLFQSLFQWGEGVLASDWSLIIAFACAFLYYEFARKITWPESQIKGQRTYSDALGTKTAVAVALGLATCAALLVTVTLKTWLPLLLLAPLGHGLSLLRRNKSMALSGTAFIGLFYGIVIAAGILARFDLRFHLLVGP